MYYDFFHIAVLLLVGIAFVYANLLIFSLFRPNKPNELKLSTYECGIEAFGSSWIRFDMRFYTVALIFVLFDLEVAFLFPWAAVFRELGETGQGTVVVIEGLIFVVILALGLFYVWAKGDLDWVKAFTSGKSHFADLPAAQTRVRVVVDPARPEDDGADAAVTGSEGPGNDDASGSPEERKA